MPWVEGMNLITRFVSFGEEKRTTQKAINIDQYDVSHSLKPLMCISEWSIAWLEVPGPVLKQGLTVTKSNL